MAGEFTLEHYAHVFTDSYYGAIFWRTFWVSALTTLICVAVGAPEAYVLSRMRSPWRSVLLLVVLAPLLVSVVVRAFGWSMLLGPEGLVNQAFHALGLPPVRGRGIQRAERHGCSCLFGSIRNRSLR